MVVCRCGRLDGVVVWVFENGKGKGFPVWVVPVVPEVVPAIAVPETEVAPVAAAAV